MDAKDKVFEYIDSIADKLGVASEHVYEILVKQQFVSGIAMLVVSIIGVIVLTLIITRVIPYNIERGNEKVKAKIDSGQPRWFASEANEDNTHIIIGSGTVGIIIFIMLLFTIPSSIKMLINPEYYAIKEILDVFTISKD